MPEGTITFELDSGDNEGSRLGDGPSLEETGETGVSSGLAIRKPPRDCARLKSPSIVYGEVPNGLRCHVVHVPLTQRKSHSGRTQLIVTVVCS